jgi:hypothetical protein
MVSHTNICFHNIYKHYLSGMNSVLEFIIKKIYECTGNKRFSVGVITYKLSISFLFFTFLNLLDLVKCFCKNVVIILIHYFLLFIDFFFLNTETPFKYHRVYLHFKC